MAALTSGSWTIKLLHSSATGETGNGDARAIDMTVSNRHKIVNAIMITATGESPAGGVPWPDKGKFGFVRNLDSIILHNVRGRSAATVGAITASGQHVIWTMNTTGQKARVFALGSASGTAQRALKQLATTVTLTGGQRLHVTAFGW